MFRTAQEPVDLRCLLLSRYLHTTTRAYDLYISRFRHECSGGEERTGSEPAVPARFPPGPLSDIHDWGDIPRALYLPVHRFLCAVSLLLEWL